MFRWLIQLFRPSWRSATDGQAHMTFAHTSVGRTVARTGVFLRKQLWIWPIIAVVFLATIGFGIRLAIERTMKASLSSQFETLLNVERSMIETWLRVQEVNAESLANDQHIREVAVQLLAADATSRGEKVGLLESSSSNSGANPPSLAALNARLSQELGPGMSSHEFVSYFLANRQQTVVAAAYIDFIGQSVPKEYESFVARALTGVTSACPPFPSTVTMKDEFGRTRTGVPTMFVCAPVRDANLQVVAVIGFRIRPEHEFTRILQLGRIGSSGETYAFDKQGRFVSNSRFDEDLILLGLLPDSENSHSILNLSAHDPGGNMRQGFRPGVRRVELPLTKPAAAAIAGAAGVDVEGYRDYRGVPSVGAYTWLPKYDMGIITECDYEEAFRPLTILRRAFYSLFALLALSSVAIFGFTLIVSRLHREAQKAAIEAKQLGQYRLETRIGSGAMGVVYRGHHAMLRRPTAIKMLNVEKVNESSIQRFEHEVQITCRLNNPHTIAIYDYGRTPEGVFYYAMEFLDGIDLQALVEKYGPQSEARVIHILKQVCGSLYEAHTQGLVHRDIKPANIMLNRRGGESDVVKVLDFGLVKAVDNERQSRQTGGLAGTPLYMSPEAIQTPNLVDARSDIYAMGAVGYYLLTGHPVFNAASLVELCQQHVVAIPESPAARLGRAVGSELESALLACLEKNPAKRPQTARDMATLLARAAQAGSWSLDEADAWWGRYERGQVAAGGMIRNMSATATEGFAAGTGVTSTTNHADSSASVPAARNTSGGFDRTIGS